MADLNVIKKEPRNAGVVAMLKRVLSEVEADPDASSLHLLVKVNGAYVRYSTGIDSPADLMLQLEIAKSDIVLQMAGLV